MEDRKLISYEVSKDKRTFNAESMNKFLDKHSFTDRQAVFDLLKDPLFQLDYSLPVERQRELAWSRLDRLRQAGFTPKFTEMLKETDPKNLKKSTLKFMAVADALGYYDNSLNTRIGAHFSLWCGSLYHLGTKYHHENILPQAERMELPGSFSLTELGHGSNARDVETVATYDTKTQEFIIHTPTETAQKYWTGNGAKSQATLVFAQLLIEGEAKGVHAFIVPTQNKDGTLCKGVRMADVGHKIGINGVDNVRFWFDNVRIPREYLLDKIGTVTPDGKYESWIQDNDMRFTAYIAELVGGRVAISGMSNSVAKLGLAIAIRYSLQRRQFGPKGKPETLIMDYLVHQRRLIPLIAITYAYNSAVHALYNLYCSREDHLKEVHIIGSVLKAIGSWHCTSTLQICREACGGMGVKSDSRIGIVKAEVDSFLTYEGDNMILLSQTCKQLLADLQNGRKKGTFGNRIGYMNDFGNVQQRARELYDNNTVDVRSEDFQHTMMIIREADLINKVGKLVAEKKNQGLANDQAWNSSFDMAAKCGKAYSDRFIFEQFTKDIKNCKDNSLVPILENLRSLYTLWLITNEQSFLAYGYLSPRRTEFIEVEVNKLLGELRPHVLALVDSFGIPDHLLAPIVLNYIEYNSWNQAVKNNEFQGKAKL